MAPRRAGTSKSQAMPRLQATLPLPLPHPFTAKTASDSSRSCFFSAKHNNGGENPPGKCVQSPQLPPMRQPPDPCHAFAAGGSATSAARPTAATAPQRQSPTQLGSYAQRRRADQHCRIPGLAAPSVATQWRRCPCVKRVGEEAASPPLLDRRRGSRLVEQSVYGRHRRKVRLHLLQPQNVAEVHDRQRGHVRSIRH